MATLLHIDTSGRREGSVSRRSSRAFVEAWLKTNPGDSVIYRDLLDTDLPFVDDVWMQGAWSPPEARGEAAVAAMRRSDALVDELLSADVLVMGLPVYNFGVPAAFKAYIDQVARAGRTFTFADGQPKGLLKAKKAFVFTASGSDFSAEPLASMNHVDPYVNTILGFLGVNDVEVINVNGRSPESVEASFERAQGRFDSLVEGFAAAA